MRISRAADYAVRCVLDLSMAEPGAVVSSRALAARTEIPPAFLAKIAQRLSRAGLLEVTRGSRGGLRLTRPPEKIDVLQVVEAVSGDVALNRCVGRVAACGRMSFCAAHPVWVEAREILRSFLKGKDFASIARRQALTGRRPRG